MNNRDNSFEGINVNRARSDITSFYEQSISAADSILSAFSNLFIVLNNAWASPVAVAFSETWSGEINSLNSNLYSNISSITNNAIESANCIASSHGTSLGAIVTPAISYKSSYTCSVCKENIGGIVAMNIPKVEAALVDFNNRINTGLEELSYIPNGISIYDNVGNVAGAFSSGVDKFKEQISQMVEVMNTKLSESIEIEKERIESAKEKAVNTLSA